MLILRFTFLAKLLRHSLIDGFFLSTKFSKSYKLFVFDLLSTRRNQSKKVSLQASPFTFLETPDFPVLHPHFRCAKPHQKTSQSNEAVQ